MMELTDAEKAEVEFARQHAGNFEAEYRKATMISRNREKAVSLLIDRLDHAQRDWDIVYPEIVEDAQNREIKVTEEKLKVAVRNEMRKRGMEIPEIVRWKLRAVLGGVEAHE